MPGIHESDKSQPHHYFEKNDERAESAAVARVSKTIALFE